MIEKPIIKRKPVILQHLPSGAFDIPNFNTHFALEYFSGNVSLETVRKEFWKNGSLTIWSLSDEELVAKLKENLIGKERFFDYISKEGSVCQKCC